MGAQIVKSVSLKNFRSHKDYGLEFSEETTQILGENGWGKTSIIEAIYIALQGRSFRAADKEIYRRGAEFYRVEVLLTSGEKIVATYAPAEAKKQFLVQDKKFLRLPRKNRYPVVLFLPEDLHLISASPSSHREYFDRFLGQLMPGYTTALSRYNKALRQRNELLKSGGVSADALFSWDVMLARYGVEIRKARAEMVSALNERLTEVYRSIAKNVDTVGLLYKSYTAECTESEYLKLLSLDYERDILTGHTNFGVHKDDYEFIFNEAAASGSASRGEVRSIILALKFIEAEMLFSKTGRRPVVMLDDVFSELDSVRQKALVSNFRENQVILTSVDGV